LPELELKETEMRKKELLRRLEQSISVTEHKYVVDHLNDIINELRAQNNELFKKLMARDLPEYETFNETGAALPLGMYDPTQDEGLAGEILNETEYEGDGQE
jgi:hypothetical protein